MEVLASALHRDILLSSRASLLLGRFPWRGVISISRAWRSSTLSSSSSPARRSSALGAFYTTDSLKIARWYTSPVIQLVR